MGERNRGGVGERNRGGGARVRGSGHTAHRRSETDSPMCF